MKNPLLFAILTGILLLTGCSQNVVHPGVDYGGNNKNAGIQSIDTARHTLKQAASSKRLRFEVKRKSM